MGEDNENNHKRKNKNRNKATKNNELNKVERPEGSTPCTDEQLSKKRKRKEIAIFGNYRNYYGYRVGHDLEDPRLKAMKREWFEGKNCLDIGCNSGLITIAIAKSFGCRSILGVDIDGARIEDAHWTLKKVIRTSTHKATAKIPGAADESVNDLNLDVSKDHLSVEKDLLKIVSFQKGNFVQNWRPPADKSYHAILCLSVSKWIHLNWGDDGLITLFSKVWMLLQPGGIFILEPQPWSSYHSNRLVSDVCLLLFYL
ncbi:hypothetical protein ACS0TY_021053 [Phlomoides rotata]